MLLPLLVVSAFCASAVSAECEPGFADNCFTSVVKDLNYMLNLPRNVAKNISKQAVDELCLALDDSLNCTSDIVDGDCSKDEGKDSFDSWIEALRGAYDYACGDEHSAIKEILQGIQCWSINDFVRCTEAQAEVGHVRDLLHTQFNDTECLRLKRVAEYCYDVGKVSSCREQQQIEWHVKIMIQSFFDKSRCSDHHAVLQSNGGRHLAEAISSLLVVPVVLSLL